MLFQRILRCFSLNKPAAAEKKEDDKEGDNAENDEDTPPKVEIAKVEEDDSFYSIRSAVFHLFFPTNLWSWLRNLRSFAKNNNLDEQIFCPFFYIRNQT